MTEIVRTENEFDRWDELLDPLGAVNSPAELQGMLCGRLCGSPLNEADWLRLVDDFMALTETPDTATVDALIKLLKDTKDQLQGDGFSFVLFLPDDEQGMSERVEALSQWCHGFLSGFGSAGVVERGTLPQEVNETLGDFAAIVQVEGDDNDAASGEADFLEIAEYVRLAALGLFEAYGESAPDRKPENNATLH
ncbi:UPF0149 family protein [Gilvimarinus polysaccharolyticus]|uniref:UPF0149 family protein n=1 Tax=Gilvimarinus polysaccharolyticus TaxID=863921 RepID=UPI000673422F|nr:UPF0149 family protein [Gilvimarinus polysaccharolyticus]